MVLIKILLDVCIYVVLPLSALVYWWVQKRFSYWKDRNVPYPEPVWSYLAGNTQGVGTKVSIITRLNEIYAEYKGKTPAVGIYTSVIPNLLILDPELAKTILVKEFAKFHDHGMYMNERDDPLSAHLFNMEGAKWRIIRNKLSPTFTSGKLKMMYSSIEQIGDRYVSVLEKYAKDKTAADMKDLTMRFTADVVGSTAFGLEVNCLNGESDLLDVNTKIFDAFKLTSVPFLFKQTFKDLAIKLRMPLFPKDISDYFMNMLRETVEHREKNNIERNDFLQLLIQLKNKGVLDGETGEVEVRKLTFNEVAAQAFVFFFAGYKSSQVMVTNFLFQTFP